MTGGHSGPGVLERDWRGRLRQFERALWGARRGWRERRGERRIERKVPQRLDLRNPFHRR